MRNPERKLREDQSLHFAQRFIETFRERLSNDPDFQRECTKAVLFSPYSISRGITLKRSNGVEYRVSMRRKGHDDKMHIIRYFGSSEEANFNKETIDIGIAYDEESRGECSLWPGERGKPIHWTVAYSRLCQRKGPRFDSHINDLTAIREIGRFLRENFPAE